MTRPARHWVVFAVAGIAVFTQSMDSTLMPLAISDIGASFDVTAPASISWILTVYTIALASAVVAAGRIGDRTGRRRTFLLGASLFMLGALIAAVSNEFWVVLLARVVQGTGSAFTFPSSLGLILAAWPEDRRTQAIGAWTAVGATGGAIGPTLGAAIVDGPGWRFAFFIPVLIYIPTLLIAPRVLVDTEREDDASLPDMVGVVLLGVSLAAIVTVLVQGRRWGWSDPRVFAGLALAAAALVSLARRSRAHPAPVIDPKLYRIPSFVGALALSVALPLAMFANFSMMAQFTQRVWGYSVIGSGLAIAPFSVTASISATLVQRASTRFDERTLALVGAVVTVLGIGYLGFATGDEPNYWRELFPAVLATGIGGWGVALTALGAIGVRDLDDTTYGVGSGLLLTARQMGGTAGVALAFGILGDGDVDLLSRFHVVWRTMAAVGIVAVLLSLRLPRRPHR